MNLEIIKEGFSIFVTRLKPYPRYKGNANQICDLIIKKCWNNKFFQTGADSYPQFWTRDFGFCTNSLIELGYKKEVQKTLKYALNIFQKQNKIGCYISRSGKVLDFPTYAVDTLPLLLHSVRLSKLNIKPYNEFLNKEIQTFYKKVINPKKGVVKETQHFSSMKDYFIRNSSCYDNCMVALLKEEINNLRLNNPLQKFNYQNLIKNHFWNGHYFNDDLTNAEITGDANVFPFWCNIFQDKKMFQSCQVYVQNEKLDKPWPLKYSKKNHFGNIWESIFVPYWEGNKIWSFLGLYYIETVSKFNKPLARFYLNQYKQHIEKNKNFIELFTKQGNPYKSLFYKADHSMLWASKYLYLDKLLNNK